ncbi:MAG: hypothetical protein NVSMB27_22780 [Ktedonobacteraceae bacterium]
MTIVRWMLTMTFGNESQEVERHGYVLDWTFDQEQNDFEYVCNKMTPEE